MLGIIPSLFEIESAGPVFLVCWLPSIFENCYALGVYSLPYLKAQTLRELQVLLQLTGLSRWVGNFGQEVVVSTLQRPRIFKGKST